MAVFTAIGTAVATATFGAAAAGTAAFTFVAGLTAAGLQIASGVALSLIGKAMRGDAGTDKARFGVQGKLQGGDDVPRSINLGFNCTAGSLVYHNTWGSGGVYSTRVIALGDVPVSSLEQVIVDGIPVTLGGTAHADYGYPVTQYSKGGTDHLWIKFYDGTQTTADSFLTGTVGDDDRPYGSERVGYGIPYAIVTALAPERSDDSEKPLFQGLPSYKFVTNGIKLYDLSKDTTAGGDGSQRWATPSTWGGDGDFLPPVQIYNLLRGVRFNGDWIYGLQNLSAARLPADNWIAAINKARATIAGPDGNEATFRSGGEVQVSAPVHLALESLITACNGRLVEVGGTYKLYVGEPSEAVMSFDDDDIISTEEQSFSPFLSLADTVNGVTATFPNPDEGWNTKTAPPLIRTDLETLDGGRRLLASVALDMVPYAGQVQRLMKWALAEALRARRHTFVMGPEFRVVEPGDIVSWSSTRNGYEDKSFRVDGAVYKSNLDVILDLTEVDPDDYDWDQETDYRTPTDGPLALVGPRALPIAGFQVTPAENRDNDGVGRRPSIGVEWSSGISDVESVRVQVRLNGETDPFAEWQFPYGNPWSTILPGEFIKNTQYQVRGIFVRTSGFQSEWSSWLSVTTPNVGFTDDDLAQFLQDKLDYADQTLRSLQEQINDLDSTAASQAAWGRDVYVKQGENLAGVIRRTEAILEADYAKASDLTLVEARVDDVDASGLFGVTSTVDEGEGEVLISLAARVQSGDTIVTSGLGVGVAGGVGYIYLDADKVIITNTMVSANGVKQENWSTGFERTVIVP